MYTFSFKKMHLKMSGKWHPSCLSLSVLTYIPDIPYWKLCCSPSWLWCNQFNWKPHQVSCKIVCDLVVEIERPDNSETKNVHLVLEEKTDHYQSMWLTNTFFICRTAKIFFCLMKRFDRNILCWFMKKKICPSDTNYHRMNVVPHLMKHPPRSI